jgi:hypothetical protein
LRFQPALERAGITEKVIGRHSFRHSLAQELLRHANSRITLEVYTRAISSTKREANDRVIQMFLDAGKKTISALSPAPFFVTVTLVDCHKLFIS